MSAQVEEGPQRLLLPWSRRPRRLDAAPLPRVLLRRADAQPRAEWLGVEEWRGLSPRGRAQADALVARLADLRYGACCPARRCAADRPSSPWPAAWTSTSRSAPSCPTGRPLDRLQALLEDDATEGAVFCTHREVLGRLFAELARAAGSPVPATVPPAASWTLVRGCSVAPCPSFPWGDRAAGAVAASAAPWIRRNSPARGEAGARLRCRQSRCHRSVAGAGRPHLEAT